jgi:hypothetical protein
LLAGEGDFIQRTLLISQRKAISDEQPPNCWSRPAFLCWS